MTAVFILISESVHLHPGFMAYKILLRGCLISTCNANMQQYNQKFCKRCSYFTTVAHIQVQTSIYLSNTAHVKLLSHYLLLPTNANLESLLTMGTSLLPSHMLMSASLLLWQSSAPAAANIFKILYFTLFCIRPSYYKAKMYMK